MNMTNSRLEHLPGQPKFLQMFRDPAEEIIEDTVEDSEESSYIVVDDDDDSEHWSIESVSSYDSGVGSGDLPLPVDSSNDREFFEL